MLSPVHVVVLLFEYSASGVIKSWQILQAEVYIKSECKVAVTKHKFHQHTLSSGVFVSALSNVLLLFYTLWKLRIVCIALHKAS